MCARIFSLSPSKEAGRGQAAQYIKYPEMLWICLADGQCQISAHNPRKFQKSESGSILHIHR